MGKVFEDDFMDLQAGLISLCLEVTNEKVDKVFAYGSIEKKSTMFNAFFEVDGKIKTLDMLGVPQELAYQFLDLGIEDLEKLHPMAQEYSRPIPTELKMYYDVKTGKFRSEYKYEEICSARTGKTAGDVFDEWIAEMKVAGRICDD